VMREFRAAWVASIGNIDWPSRRGLSTAQQKAELIAILDRAVQLRLNAIILQVRPACDALYASKFEPWSEYLCGQMGQAPSPYYDPLTFAVTEAHARGLELHAWFNPFRVRHTSASSPASRLHISKTQPNLVRTYGNQLWLDPGEAAVRDYSIRVILDVVQRYDVDAVHIDDYFYPYAEKDRMGKVLPFPDWVSWRKYRAAGGTATRDDWRRDNVNQFVRRLYESVKTAKAHVKFGVSPFGIWRPNHPPGIEGHDAYAQVYADARKWLREGWLDYFAPQLYWPAAQQAQSYPALLRWWADQNVKHRHLWPGNSHRNSADEILYQIRLTRSEPRATGNLHWSMKALMANRNGVADALLQQAYAQPALVPASPWLDRSPPAQPTLAVNTIGGRVEARWSTRTNDAWLWLVQTKTTAGWITQILSQRNGGLRWSINTEPELIAVTAIDRSGNASPPTVVTRLSQPPQPYLSGDR
ncbi:MAG TPA: family 10 glycosylhydrolase, partial [Candidatus Entotheonella sp.]